VLATSREVLGMQGELVHRVASLSVPDVRRPCPIAELREFEAVRLFLDRAGLSQPGFELTEENAPLVGRICVHLDGIPLAIELAAARLRRRRDRGAPGRPAPYGVDSRREPAPPDPARGHGMEL
jgi:non-specific serine/threonine protein kinase